MSAEPPIWTPSLLRLADANLTRFMAFVTPRGAPDADYRALYQWSIEQPGAFWEALFEFAGVIAERGTGPVLVDGERMPGARWFPDTRLNFAENLLRGLDDEPALIFRNERGTRRELSWQELRNEVARIADGLRASGVGPGDRVAGFLPNLPEAVIAMLAAASVGATWTSCSPDFGIHGVLDRFGQVAPKVLFTADGYFYAGKTIDSLVPIAGVLQGLPSCTRVVVVSYLNPAPAIGGLPHAVAFDEFGRAGAALDFERLAFDHPLYVLYSSCTTGMPKCIVHGAGGTLLQHLKEHLLHTDVKPGDRLFYFTTCGWMMWNWLASGLAQGCTLVLYDGSPAHPRPERIFELAQSTGISVLGTSPKFLASVQKAGLKPRGAWPLPALRTILSTGAPLEPAQYHFVHESVKRDVQLASIAGGTDLIGCFMLGNPIAPVYAGEIQGPALGMDIAAFDPDGQPVVGRQGELVCRQPFPSMPIFFWSDADGVRYRRAYFERYSGVWHHGDFVTLTKHGGVIVYGRSDATLNPGGVRIGTAEIYRIVEALPAVQDSIVVGQRQDGEERVVLFVVLRGQRTLDDALAQTIRQAIRDNASPRHVPAVIRQINRVLAASRPAGIRVVFLQMGWEHDRCDAGTSGSPNWHKSRSLRLMRQRPELDGKLMIKGTWDYALVDDLKPQPQDLVVHKPRYSGFYSTNLDGLLRERGIRNLVFTGIATNVCVESTLRDAFFLEYFPLLVTDSAMQSGPPSLHEATVYNVQQFFGWVTSTDEYVNALGAVTA